MQSTGAGSSWLAGMRPSSHLAVVEGAGVARALVEGAGVALALVVVAGVALAVVAVASVALALVAVAGVALALVERTGVALWSRKAGKGVRETVAHGGLQPSPFN